MIEKRYLPLIINVICLFVFSFSTWGGQTGFAESMKSRLGKVVQAKDAGLIGEGTDGLLHLRIPSENMQKLVREENADRKALFESLAKKTGGSILDVASKFSIGLAKKAKKGHWFKKANGDWIRK